MKRRKVEEERKMVAASVLLGLAESADRPPEPTAVELDQSLASTPKRDDDDNTAPSNVVNMNNEGMTTPSRAANVNNEGMTTPSRVVNMNNESMTTPSCAANVNNEGMTTPSRVVNMNNDVANMNNEGMTTPSSAVNMNTEGTTTPSSVVNMNNENTLLFDSDMELAFEGNNEKLLKAMTLECYNLRVENHELRTQLNRNILKEDGFRGDDEKVRFYTGVPSFALLTTIFAMIIPFVKPSLKLSGFQMCLLTCMRMRMNLGVQFLGYLFGVSSSSVSRVFHDVLTVMHTRLVPLLIVWPERDILKMTMPMSFRSKFSKCACIIDCFEIFIERPSDLKARAQTYSTYKSHNTMKYLIGITPQGTISFISKGWGGRTSDKHVTERCGFLDHLSPGDLILADRGFNIAETLGSCSASLKIPAFTKGKSQLSALDVESTRGLAAVRIHVERVIGMTRQKYAILGTTIPNTLCVADTTGLTTLDKIVHVASALTNLSPPIVAFD